MCMLYTRATVCLNKTLNYCSLPVSAHLWSSDPSLARWLTSCMSLPYCIYSYVYFPLGLDINCILDRSGRRFNCLLYAILYSSSCVTKHFPNFWILMIGRLLGGSATSILFSAFEAWLVCEHNRVRSYSHVHLHFIFLQQRSLG